MRVSNVSSQLDKHSLIASVVNAHHHYQQLSHALPTTLYGKQKSLAAPQLFCVPRPVGGIKEVSFSAVRRKVAFDESGTSPNHPPLSWSRK